MTKKFLSEPPTKPSASILCRKSGEEDKDFDRSLVLLTGGTSRVNGDYIDYHYQHSNHIYGD
nr:MAG TPA: hypothetical protein [Microviridae sp.]